jgi:carbonic anhydrase
MLKSTKICVAGLMAAASLYAADQAPVWNHNPKSENGTAYWGSVSSTFATCGTTSGEKFNEVGTRQTPVNIETAKATPAFLSDLRFTYADTAFEVENTGHVIEVMYETGSSLSFASRSNGIGVCTLQAAESSADSYQLVQFHFHAPSEHTIDGNSYDLELHLVHQNSLGELAVVGVLFSKGTDPTPLLDDLMLNAPTKEGSTTVGTRRINISQLLPADRTYYSYSGSLTTPPCSEGVRWFVMKTPLAVSPFALNRIHSLISGFEGYEGFPNNNRPTMPLNGRSVLVRK